MKRHTLAAGLLAMLAATTHAAPTPSPQPQPVSSWQSQDEQQVDVDDYSMLLMVEEEEPSTGCSGGKGRNDCWSN